MWEQDVPPTAIGQSPRLAETACGRVRLVGFREEGKLTPEPSASAPSRAVHLYQRDCRLVKSFRGYFAEKKNHPSAVSVTTSAD